MSLTRRDALLGASTVLAGTSLHASAAERGAAPSTKGGVPVTMSDEALLNAFAKARFALDDRLTIGWVDATTYAFIEGAIYPLYRLLAATWVRLRRVDELHFKGRTLETAYFFHPDTGELLTELRMPVTGKVVPVKPYRAGPSPASLGVREESSGTFRMSQESRDGASFFREGSTQKRQLLSQPMREGDDLYIREELGTRVMGPDSPKPIFFYAEWTVTRMNWKDVQNPKLAWVDSTLQYSAVAAFRPWMQMDGVDGHTLQNGRGGRARRTEDLPPRFVEMVRRFDADLLEDPVKVLGAMP